MRIVDLFAGIGGFRLAFESEQNKVVFSSEIDRFAQRTYEANFGELPAGDITQIDEKDIPEFDLLLAGFPCQPFSYAGLKKGFNDVRGTLFFDILRIVKYHLPHTIVLENVKGLVRHDKGKTLQVIVSSLEQAGYKVQYKVLNSLNFGSPQRRERIYIVAFRDHNTVFEFPKYHNDRYTQFGEILEPNPDKKYTISDKAWAGHQARLKRNKGKGTGFGYRCYKPEAVYVGTLIANYHRDGASILIEQDGKNPRKLTPREAARLQGFPELYTFNMSDTQTYKQLGNSVCIPVVKALAKAVYAAKSLDNHDVGFK